MNIITKTKAIISLVFTVMVVTLTICGGACPKTTTNAPLTIATRASDRVEVTLFYSPDNCACMQNAKAWIETTINTDYQAQVISGKLVYHAYNIDDAANATLKQQFDATSLSFYFTDVHGTVITTREYKGLWLYLDTSLENENLKTQFINLLKKELDKRLAGS